MASFTHFNQVFSGIATSKSVPGVYGNIGIQRTPSDPFFVADVTINNAVVGSRYWLVNNDDHSTVLATGIISSAKEVLADIPSYGDPMLMLLRLRNASSSPKYKQYEAIVPHSITGSFFYTAQVLDE